MITFFSLNTFQRVHLQFSWYNIGKHIVYIFARYM